MKSILSDHLLLRLALLCLPLAHLHAAPLRVLAWDDEVAARELSIVHGKGQVELESLHPFNRSGKINVTVTAEAPVRLLARDRTDEAGAPATEIIQIPAGTKHPLLLLLPDEKLPTGIRTLVLEDDPANFQWGTIRMINSTGRPLVFRWEKKLAALPPSWTPTKVTPGGATRNMGVAMFLRDEPDRPLYSAVWEHRQDARTLVFVVPGTDTTRSPVEFKFIMETPADLAASEKAGG